MSHCFATPQICSGNEGARFLSTVSVTTSKLSALQHNKQWQLYGSALLRKVFSRIFFLPTRLRFRQLVLCGGVLICRSRQSRRKVAKAANRTVAARAERARWARKQAAGWRESPASADQTRCSTSGRGTCRWPARSALCRDSTRRSARRNLRTQTTTTLESRDRGVVLRNASPQAFNVALCAWTSARKVLFF